MRTAASPPSSDLDLIKHIWRTHGLRGFYRGITATALRDIGYGAYFAAYEATLRYWPRPHAPHARTDTHSREGEVESRRGGRGGCGSWERREDGSGQATAVIRRAEGTIAAEQS